MIEFTKSIVVVAQSLVWLGCFRSIDLNCWPLYSGWLFFFQLINYANAHYLHLTTFKSPNHYLHNSKNDLTIFPINQSDAAWRILLHTDGICLMSSFILQVQWYLKWLRSYSHLTWSYPLHPSSTLLHRYSI